MDLGFLRSARWITGTVLAVAAIGVFTALGSWQLRRLDEVRAGNDLIEARLGAAPVDLDDLLAVGGRDAEALRWRRVFATGRYDGGAQVVLVGRSHLASSGSNVLTPLLLADGTGIIVNRGWIPIDDPAPAAETGIVVVSGVLRPGEGGGVIGGGNGPVDEVGSIDLDRLDAQLPYELLPVYLQVESIAGSGADVPLPVPIPERDEGPHLSYAVQWFLFAAITLIGFPILVVRTARVETRRRTPSTPSS